MTELVQRPFEGLPGECDWVALRELVPAATVELTLKDGLPEGVPSVTLATVLPMAWPALRRDDGSVLLGLQNDTASGDISRDLADTLQRALTAEPGTPVAAPARAGRRSAAAGPARPEGAVRAESCTPASSSGSRTRRTPRPEVAASLERANAAAIPTVKLAGVDAAYWCETPEKNHLRWVMPHPEEQLLDALARLHAAGALLLGEGTRLVGSFRAHGLTVPVWDLPSGDGRGGRARSRRPSSPSGSPRRWPTDAPLTADERRARGGLTNRQVTLS